MPQRIGLIQSRGIGDIIIALPIADYFLEQGCEVHWPIHSGFLAAFQQAKPQVHWTGLDEGPGYFYEIPLERLSNVPCDRIIPLYSHLRSLPHIPNAALAASLKFDEYKYAVAGVPFSRKWDLRLERDQEREQKLHEQLAINRPYICVHTHGADC